tara:strand:+ start:701 stop:841 length:141 start_codon:yes stop_codon:yes gene_type:complete
MAKKKEKVVINVEDSKRRVKATVRKMSDRTKNNLLVKLLLQLEENK